MYKFYKITSLKYGVNINITSKVYGYYPMDLKSSIGRARVLILKYPTGSDQTRILIIAIGLGFEF